VGKITVKLTANFERNLAEIERFWMEAGAPLAYDTLLDELIETVVPNLERFPGMGRPFLDRPTGSVEVANAQNVLRSKLAALDSAADSLREYVMRDYLVLYAWIGVTVHLLSIRHHRQLSFDFARHFG
jgi:plasmid stabilization system protein ParE